METYHIVVIGTTSVGKTELIHRYVNDCFDDFNNETIGIDIKYKNLRINDKNIKLIIYDTCGRSRFIPISHNYYRSSLGALFLFDITRNESFELLKPFYDGYNESAPKNNVKILVGAKCDLDYRRNISKEEAMEFAHNHSMKYFEVSAKENINVNQLFDTLINDILLQNDSQFNQNIEPPRTKPSASQNASQNKKGENEVDDEDAYVLFKL